MAIKMRDETLWYVSEEVSHQPRLSSQEQESERKMMDADCGEIVGLLWLGSDVV
jgi:hypothetical protein